MALVNGNASCSETQLCQPTQSQVVTPTHQQAKNSEKRIISSKITGLRPIGPKASSCADPRNPKTPKASNGERAWAMGRGYILFDHCRSLLFLGVSCERCTARIAVKNRGCWRPDLTLDTRQLSNENLEYERSQPQCREWSQDEPMAIRYRRRIAFTRNLSSCFSYCRCRSADAQPLVAGLANESRGCSRCRQS